jgi:putative methionine-R-sulfoxide reductase with GAF domain
MGFYIFKWVFLLSSIYQYIVLKKMNGEIKCNIFKIQIWENLNSIATKIKQTLVVQNVVQIKKGFNL